jgi:hypothetical protein
MVTLQVHPAVNGAHISRLWIQFEEFIGQGTAVARYAVDVILPASNAVRSVLVWEYRSGFTPDKLCDVVYTGPPGPCARQDPCKRRFDRVDEIAGPEHWAKAQPPEISINVNVKIVIAWQLGDRHSDDAYSFEIGDLKPRPARLPRA